MVAGIDADDVAERCRTHAGRGTMAVVDDATAAWLLDGDPAVRWRTCELIGAPAAGVARERDRVATDGWGARLLGLQDPDGGWGEGAYSPKWTSTTYTLLHLMWLGLPAENPAALRGLEQVWGWWSRRRVPETCITAILVRLTCTLGVTAPRVDDLVADLLSQQQHDGGWNCATRTDRAKHSSFHTSIQALEALLAYERSGGGLATSSAQQRGRQFFLDHRLYCSHRTGQVAIPASTRFPAFPEWHFDVLRGLEHLTDADADRDERLTDAITVVRGGRRRDGRWVTYAAYPASRGQWFELEPRGPSRWTTVRALRVLRWWEGVSAVHTGTTPPPADDRRRC